MKAHEIILINGLVHKSHPPFKASYVTGMQNWIATIENWIANTRPGSRKFWKASSALGMYHPPADLKVGDIIEEACDTVRDGKKVGYYRKYFRILEISEKIIKVEEVNL